MLMPKKHDKILSNSLSLPLPPWLVGGGFRFLVYFFRSFRPSNSDLTGKSLKLGMVDTTMTDFYFQQLQMVFV